MKLCHAVAALSIGLWSVSAFAAEAPPLKLEKGDHVCIIGNTLAERMQHDGWLEALIVSRFPQHDITIRNLGYSGDEIDESKRLRSKDFGTPDEWLSASAPVPQHGKKPAGKNYSEPKDEGFDENRFELAGTKADVIFAFFGYNESFAGDAGMAKFKQVLADELKHMLSKQYNGKSAPRIVLFSPIAHQDLKDPNLPNGEENNARLAKYTAAMAEVAKEQGVTFVDLFTPTKALYATSGPLTINGIHLNEAGNKAVAQIIEKALFGAGQHDEAKLAKIRDAVRDKNFHWYHRYRTTDGFSVFGGRAFLAFTEGQTNYIVMQRELRILDMMTANRDQVVWAAAQGRDIKPDDSNLPPFIPVKTNRPGKGPGGEHEYLSGTDEISHMKVGAGLKVQLFASEVEFPELIAPVQMSWDTKGRLWVAVWPNYPHWTPRHPLNDKLLIFEDTNGDGKADKVKTFAADLDNPTGFEFWNGGVIVAQGPDVVFLKDTNGDDVYDVKERIIHGLDTADTHHTANSFVLDPGGALYMQEGTFHHSQVESPYRSPLRNANGAVFRYEPRTQKFEVYVTYGFANPHGHVFDAWGEDMVTDGTGAQTYLAANFSGQTDFPQKHGGAKTIYKQRTRPCPGTEILSSSHFPDEFQGNLLVGNVIGFQGILRYQLAEKDSGFEATEKEPILFSDDVNFRPSDIEIGPDGALYFTDWQNVIIGHMQHNLRDPSRDHKHGRIYRVSCEGREPTKQVPIAGQPVNKLLDTLKSPDGRVRYRTRIELSGRPTAEVMAALGSWVESLDSKDPEYQHHLTEALWLHQSHNVVDEPLLKRMLASPDFHARAAATRVLCYWRDRVNSPLDLLRERVNDEAPRVRLEAVRALSFFHDPKASEIAAESLIYPQDDNLKYVFQETMNTLDKRAKEAKEKKK